MASDITDTDDELMYLDGFVGDDYEVEYYDDDLFVEQENKPLLMAQYPMAVEVNAHAAKSFPPERHLFVADGRCVLNAESLARVMVKNGTVSTMRLSTQEPLYYFPDYDDEKRYMDAHHIVIKKEDLLWGDHPFDDIAF